MSFTGIQQSVPVTVQACLRGGGPYCVQSFESGRWVTCPGTWVSPSDARRYAQTAAGVHSRAEGFRVIPVADLDRERRVDSYVRTIPEYRLRDAGLVRLGTMIRSATDHELDQMWAPKSRVARRRAAREAPPEKPVRVSAARMGLLRMLRLDFVGHDIWSIAKVPKMRPWVSSPRLELGNCVESDGFRRVTVRDRVFAEGSVDYANANTTGSHGVAVVYTLRQGVPYEVFDRARRLGPRRVFMIHDGVTWHDISAQEAYDASR